MPDESFADAPVLSPGARLQPSARALLLVLNFIPLLHAALIAATVLMLRVPFAGRAAAGLAVLYLVPPLVVRALLSVAPVKEGRIAADSRGFFVWWTTFQWQVIFCRFPALEEVLRLIPGLYSLWLRLWGARVGRLTFWAPGTLILDRPFLLIGDGVVFGAGVRLNAHVLAKGSAGAVELQLATIVIGDGASIGGYSLLTAGTEIAPGEATRAFLISPPFSKWRDGKRVRAGETDGD